MDDKFKLTNIVYYKEGYLKGLVEAELSYQAKNCLLYYCTMRMHLINMVGDDEIEFDADEFYIWNLIEGMLHDFYIRSISGAHC